MKNKLSHTIAIAALLLIAPNLFAQQPETITPSAKKIETVIRTLNAYYVDSINDEKLAESAIRNMLKELDPHSVYISKEEVDEMNEPLVGNFEGIGIQFQILEDTIMVVYPIFGGPSEQLGIKAGDKIVKIEGETVAGTNIKQRDVMKKLRGQKGTKVTISIFRPDEKNLLEFTITRDKIPIYSVEASYMATPDIGYIKLTRFSATTIKEFHEAVSKLKSQGMLSLILDLKGNSGGYLQTAIDLGDEFLGSQKQIVYTQGRVFPKDEKFATSRGVFETGKLVIMIDNGSASASEIVAGAVQDWDRGIIVGIRSYAKGLVQKPYNLPDGSVVRVTIAKYYTPTGRCIQKPYEDYKDEYSKRMERGEFFHPDSIHIPDSLKFFTPKKRVVFGGGGIIPDVFVPIDTMMNSAYYNEIIRKGVMNEFPLGYFDANKKRLFKEYPALEKFKSGFQVSDMIMNDFIVFAEKKGVKRNDEQMKISETTIKQNIQALIARSMWGPSAYWEIMNGINTTYNKAVEVIQNDSFDKMQLVYE